MRPGLVGLVARREVVERTRTKSYRMSTLVYVLAAVAAVIIPEVVGDDGPTTYDIGIVGAVPPSFEAIVTANAGAGDARARVRSFRTLAEAEAAVREEDVDLALVDGARLLVREEDDDEQVVGLVNQALSGASVQDRLARAGVPESEAARLLAAEPLPVDALEPASVDDNQPVVFAGILLLYISLITYGTQVATGVVEEKSSRVSEVLLGAVRPHQLLAGKVAGIGVIGLGQLVAFVVLGLAAASLSGTIDLPPEAVPVAFQVVGWFVLGFAFYSSLFAVGGAMASLVEELQSTTTPLTFVVMGSFFAAITTGGDPGGPVAQVATYLPPSAPLVMPMRMAAGEVGIGTVVLSVAIVLVAIAGVVTLAGRVYAGGALHLRGQLKLRTALAEGRRVDREPAA